jgi:hypothetical protein
MIFVDGLLTDVYEISRGPRISRRARNAVPGIVPELKLPESAWLRLHPRDVSTSRRDKFTRLFAQHDKRSAEFSTEAFAGIDILPIHPAIRTFPHCRRTLCHLSVLRFVCGKLIRVVLTFPSLTRVYGELMDTTHASW